MICFLNKASRSHNVWCGGVSLYHCFLQSTFIHHFPVLSVSLWFYLLRQCPILTRLWLCALLNICVLKDTDRYFFRNPWAISSLLYECNTCIWNTGADRDLLSCNICWVLFAVNARGKNLTKADIFPVIRALLLNMHSIFTCFGFLCCFFFACLLVCLFGWLF